METTIDYEPPFDSVDHYTLLSILGRGGMGTVYLARNEKTAREVALKLGKEDVRTRYSSRERFLREIKMMEGLRHDGLRHEHIVELLDYSWTSDVMYLVTEYCDGGTIADLVKERGRLPRDEPLRIAYQILDALQYAHSAELHAVKTTRGLVSARGIVHRDIKPSNILLVNTPDGQDAKIGDFGLAKAFELAGLTEVTTEGTVGGTRAFAPRQQLINFKRVGPEVDVWATAATLYFMLTGSPPRDLLSSMLRAEVSQVVFQTAPVPIRERNVDLPALLCELIDTALDDTNEQGLQFGSASEFEVALRATADSA